MYEIAVTVAACLRAGTTVDVAWALETHGFSERDHAEALALTPGGGRVGGVLSGALNDQLADLATSGHTGRLLDLQVSDVEAMVVGLACGGHARCLLVSAGELPPRLWDLLREREPVCLVATLDGDAVRDIRLYGRADIAAAGEDAARLFERGTSANRVLGDTAISVFWPVPTLAIAGAGAIAEAIAANAELLGWRVQQVRDGAMLSTLSRLDKVLVISHDVEFAGPALAAALAGPVGYIGALGSRRTQASRADWLAAHDITDLSRIHGPAGLDVGANTPAEIAIAILAEALAVSSGASTRSLQGRVAPIHAAPAAS